MGSSNGKPRIKLYDYRHDCGRKLYRAWLPPGTVIETRCPKCGLIHQVRVPLNASSTAKLTLSRQSL